MSARDIQPASEGEAARGPSGRSVIAAIGIDRYQGWRRLTNAVSDARGALTLFGQLGFEQVSGPLLDDAATGKAIQELVMDDLRTLGPEDRLVLFYAGHGGTRTDRPAGQEVKTGYLIPVDATDRAATWIELDGWLRAVSKLPAKHILVILDACHSGIALGPIIKWRDTGTWQGTPLSTLQARRSRRIITSALDDQVALDSGPVYGHSLFTGCLIEGLTYGPGRGDRRVTTGSELGLYVQRRVAEFPHARQTPDFGTFDFDERGELVIPLVIPLVSTGSEEPAAVGSARPVGAPASKPPIANPVPTKAGGNGLRRWVSLGGGTALAFTMALVVYSAFGEAPSSHPVDEAIADAPSRPPEERPPAAAVAVRPHSAGAASPGCPDGMVRVPGGTFQMGSPDGTGDPEENPQHAVTLSSYCIDRTEVTVGAYAACVAAKGCAAWNGSSEEDVKKWIRFCNKGDRRDHPMNCVDWSQAAAYCKWAGKRLPTEAEWEYAARHDPKTGKDHTYPWGDDPPSAKRLNACGGECVAMARRDLKVSWEAMYEGSDGWETTAPVGSYPDGASPVGALDMAGNVSEWTEDWYGDYSAAAVTDPPGATTGTARVVRGGAWINLGAGLVRAANRDRYEASSRLIYVGFRCARGG